MIKFHCFGCHFEMMASENQKNAFCPCCGTSNPVPHTAATPVRSSPVQPAPSRAAGSEAPTAYSGTLPYIFVSYAHRDSARVLPLIKGLQRRGFRVWYDAGIEAGTEWPDYIAARLEGCACFIPFLSAASVASQNCRQEIEFAISGGKTILAVHLEDLSLPAGLRLRLGLTQAMFATRFGTDDAFLNQLAAAPLLQKCK